MMKEKRKGLLQRGIMVAVSALTIMAGAGTVLAYSPVQSSDMSFEDVVLDFEPEQLLFNDSDMTAFIDFSKSDKVFTAEDGTQIPLENDYSPYAICTHSMVNGTVSAHKRNGSGGCTVKVYTCQRCKKCGYLANAVYQSTHTYVTCPHN